MDVGVPEGMEILYVSPELTGFEHKFGMFTKGLFSKIGSTVGPSK